MDAETIDKVLELARPTFKQKGNLEYSTQALKPIMEPQDSSEEVMTLTGLVDLMNAHINGAGWDNLYVHVHNPKCVSVSQLTCDDWGRRQTHIVCKLPDYGRFNFGEYMGQEKFIIGLQAFFDREHSTDFEAILVLASKLKAEAVSEATDDGVAQSVTLRKGVALAERAEVKRIVQLRPYRTFREVEQPESSFIFRLRSNEGELPSLSLHVADADMWQATAMKSIKDYLSEKLPGLNIIA